MSKEKELLKEIMAKRFNEGLKVGQEAGSKAILEAAQAKQAYLDENERLTNLLLSAEAKIQELLAQPEPKPVAWMWEQQNPHSGEWDSEFAEGKPQNFRVVRNICPLYTLSPKKEPLSDEAEAIHEIFSKNQWVDFIELARAIKKERA